MLIGVGVAILRPDGAVLVGRRVYAGEVSSWCLPGGKVDPGESFAEAAARETLEETGIALDVATLRSLGLLLDVHRAAPRVTAAFACPAPEAAMARVMEPAKIGEWRWARPDALPEPLFDPTTKIIDLLAGRSPEGAYLYGLEAWPAR